MNYVHHTAVIGPNVELGEGNYIGPFCIIGMPAEHRDYWPECGKVIIGNNNIFTGHVTIDAGTAGATIIKDDCWFLKHSHVGHDAIIESNVTISCGAKVGGHAIIQRGCNLGLNAVIHQRKQIAEGCIIGMGAVVTKKLVTEPYMKYAGNPAKLLGVNDAHPDYTIYMRDSI